MLAIAIGLDTFVALLFLNAPHTMEPPYTEPPSVVGWLVPAVGVVANVLGLVWMIRIYPAFREPRAFWRFRRR